MIDIADAVRAFEPDAAPILSAARWRNTSGMHDGGNTCQINIAVYKPPDREPAIRALKQAMEAAITSRQTAYRGSISTPRRTASAHALGVTPEQIAVVFLRPFHDVPLPDGQHMLIAEWRTEIA